jgi:hypothetical protein
MNVKRIGTVLMVGLLVFSAMVVLVGTAAAEPYPVRFYGRITDAGENVPVEIKMTQLGNVYLWTTTTGPGGEYDVERFLDSYTNIRIKNYYELSVDGEFVEGKWLIAIPPPNNGGSDFTWVYGENCGCKWTYPWDTTHEIPEFSSIAIPIASILGLLFFFNCRKHRKG